MLPEVSQARRSLAVDSKRGRCAALVQASQNTGQWPSHGRPPCRLVGFGFGGHVALYTPDAAASGEIPASPM